MAYHSLSWATLHDSCVVSIYRHQARPRFGGRGGAFWRPFGHFCVLFWEKVDFLCAFLGESGLFCGLFWEKVDFFVCFFGRKWTFLCTSWEKMDSLKSLLHAFSVKVDFFLAKYAQNCGHVKNTEKIQQNYAQIKMYFVTVKIFSEV